MTSPLPLDYETPPCSVLPTMSVSDGLVQKAHYLQTDTPPSLYKETPVPPGEAVMVPRDGETETAVSKKEAGCL